MNVPPVLELRDVARSFGGNRAVDGVSLTLHRGERLALIGPNGAGKSTLFNLIDGQLAPDRGSMRLTDGAGRTHALAGLPPRRIAALGVARTFQVAETYAGLTVRQNVQASILGRPGSTPGWARIVGLGERAHRTEAEALVADVGLTAQADRPATLLPYADRKRLELAMALAVAPGGAPCLLLMDEPTAGMAPPERHALMDLTARLVRERGIAVLFTEHSMDVVFRHAARIVVMARGRIVADGTPAQIRDDAQARQVYLGDEVPA